MLLRSAISLLLAASLGSGLPAFSSIPLWEQTENRSDGETASADVLVAGSVRRDRLRPTSPRFEVLPQGRSHRGDESSLQATSNRPARSSPGSVFSIPLRC